MSKHQKEMGVLKEHLGKHQLKYTRQRELILDAFLKQEHITAEEMYHQLARKDPHLGLATIYRTLNLFCEAGLAQARHFDFVIINSLFETALFDLKTVVHSQRLKYAAQMRNRSQVFAALGLV